MYASYFVGYHVSEIFKNNYLKEVSYYFNIWKEGYENNLSGFNTKRGKLYNKILPSLIENAEAMFGVDATLINSEDYFIIKFKNSNS